MLIVGGTITVDPNHVDQLRPAIATMVTATLEEAGCHQYSFAQSLVDPAVIQVYEIWQSPEDLEAHFETPHMAEFREALGAVTITSRELYRYEVTTQTRM